MKAYWPSVAALIGLAFAAHGASAPDAGRACEPNPQSEPLYATQAPDVDPALQRVVIPAIDGAGLFVETWLPTVKDGRTPPARIPTILIMTPYVTQGVEEYPGSGFEDPGFIAYMTARGYAVAQHHVRGTGESGGCLEQTSTLQIDDGARVVEYLGRNAPWTDGNVGMYGISYDAETQISVAGLGDPERTQYLKAIIPVSSVGGQYEYAFFDGVPYLGRGPGTFAGYLRVSAWPGDTSTPGQYLQKVNCQPEMLVGYADLSGDLTPFWQVREYRPGAPNVRAATLYVHGLADWNVKPLTIAGWFDRLTATTPHKGIFGVWDHWFPDSHPRVQPEWARADWLPMVTAWFDRYLKGLDTGVEKWPDVQVQGSDGQWRAEPEFPTTGGPAGQLALAASGGLGTDAEPSGATELTEAPIADDRVPQTVARFLTPALTAPLHITGQPVLDLWMTSSQPDAHLVATLEVLGADGEVLTHAGSLAQRHATYGYRSLRHLATMPDNYFVQQQGQPAAINTPIRVPIRFHPNDLVVPAGGKLRLTISGAAAGGDDIVYSGAAATIRLLHDCEHVSALRFLMAREHPDLLNIRETDEHGTLRDHPVAEDLSSDGGGIATAPVCGNPPQRLDAFGPELPAPGDPTLCEPPEEDDPPPVLGEPYVSYGFDTGADGWQADGSPSWSRSSPGVSDGADDPTTASFAIEGPTQYVDQMDATLTSPPIATEAGRTVVEFWLKTNLENGFDFVTVAWSADGTTWTPIREFTGANDGYPNWTRTTVDFESPGGPIEVRFRFTSDDVCSALTPPLPAACGECAGMCTGVRVDEVVVGRQRR